MTCKVLKVTHCGPIEVEGLDDVIAGLDAINNTLNAEVVVQPGDEWAALLQAATTAALEEADIEVAVNNTPIAVTIDTSEGPVEVTGNVTVDGEVTVTNFPTSFAINNLADLEGLTLTVTLDGETVTVTPDQAFIDALQQITDAIESAVRVDYEETGMCGFDADGMALSPPVKQFIERRYSHTGLFLGSDVVLSQYAADGTITGYDLAAGETVGRCKTDIPCVFLGSLKKVVLPEPGADLLHWFVTNPDGSAGNAVAHDTIDVTFPNGVHASNAAPDLVETEVDFTFSDVAGGTAQGASQSYMAADVLIPADGFITETNGNTGEFVRVLIDGIDVTTYEDLTDTPNRGAINTPIAITEGVKTVEIFVADTSVFGGATLQFSETIDGTFANLPAYKVGTIKHTCVKVEKCNGVLYDAVTNEVVAIETGDQWTDCAQLAQQKKTNELLASVIGNPDDECPCDDEV